MAEEAHSEPTMEEILASIRKIISEDDAPPNDTAEALNVNDVDATETVEDDADALSLDALAAETRDDDDSIFEEFDLSDLPEDEAAPAEEAVEITLAPDAAAALDELMDDEFPLEDADVSTPVEGIEEVVLETAPEPEPVAVAAPATPPPVQEPVMQTLTEDSTADAAAGALARLVSKMDMGSENTLEGIVRELLKPMMKEWLDANLPAIVEDKVEAEVQRIARMAR